MGRRGGMRRGGRRGSWCVPRAGVSPAVLQNNINYACSNGADCHAIQAGGACFGPNNLQLHAAYAMNAYYRTHGQQPSTCNFAGTGFVTPRNPSNLAGPYLFLFGTLISCTYFDSPFVFVFVFVFVIESGRGLCRF